jgi:hypothetical protein
VLGRQQVEREHRERGGDDIPLGPRTYRYRLTITVDTPEGERQGSGVIQVRIDFASGLLRAQGWAIWVTVRGEATVVDLGERGLLFALLFSDSSRMSRIEPYTVGEKPFSREKFRGKHYDGISSSEEYAAYLDELIRQKPKAELNRSDLPLLVRFRDLKDFTSVERVDPFNLAASFGSGVTLKRAFVEITDDPVTKTIKELIPPNYADWRRIMRYADPLYIGPEDFRQGL